MTEFGRELNLGPKLGIHGGRRGRTRWSNTF